MKRRTKGNAPAQGDAVLRQVLVELMGEVEALRARCAMLSAVVISVVKAAPQPTREAALHQFAAVIDAYQPMAALAVLPGAYGHARLAAVASAEALEAAMAPPASDTPPSPPGAPPPGSRVPTSGAGE